MDFQINQKKRQYRLVTRKDKILLLGFQTELTQFKLTNEITIRKGNREELREFYENIKYSNIQNQEFILEYEYEESNENLFYSKKLFKLLDDFNIFSRIFFDGKTKVSYSIQYLKVEGEFQSVGFASNSKVSNYIESDFILTEGDSENLPELWQAFQKQFENRNIQLAFRRFLFSIEKHEYEDQLIDLMIAFETFFVKRNERGISRKISRRASVLLAKHYTEDSVSEFLLKAYQTRSEIVHGSSFKFNEMTSREKLSYLGRMVKGLSELLSTSLYIKIINYTDLSNEQIIDHLDHISII